VVGGRILALVANNIQKVVGNRNVFIAAHRDAELKRT